MLSSKHRRGHHMTRVAVAISLLFASISTMAADNTKPVTIPIQIVKGFPTLVASIGERDMPLMFDLGGYESISLTPEAMKIAGVVRLSDETHTWKDAKGNVIEA